MQEYLNWFTGIISEHLPSILGAVAILVIGWLFALVISVIFRKLLRKTSLDTKLAGWIGGEEKAKEIPIARYASKVVYYFILLFVLVAFFQTIGLTIVTEPLNKILNEVSAFAPQILAAVVILFIAWALASFLRMIISRALKAAKLDERLWDKTALKEGKQIPVSKTIANAVYWLIYLLFLPALIDILNLEGILTSVQGITNKVLGFLPYIFTSAVILIVGWIFAVIVKRIVINISSAAGIDDLSEKAGLPAVLGKKKVSEVLGIIVHILILIPVIIAALESLSLDSITQPAMNMLNIILSALPVLFAAALIVIVSYIVGKVLSTLVANMLSSMGFNSIWVKLGLAKTESSEKGKSPSEFVGYLVLLTILFFSVIEALQLLNFENVAQLVSQFTVFAGDILIGLIIFAIGLFLANLVSQRIKEIKTPQASFYSTLARITILVLIISMALKQMGFADEIVVIAFASGFGAVAISFAVAFGIGGRDIAARKLEEWTKKL